MRSKTGGSDNLIWWFWVIVIFLFLSACSNEIESEGTSFDDAINEVKVDGHEYLIYKGYYKGGMTHKANCEATHYE